MRKIIMHNLVCMDLEKIIYNKYFSNIDILCNSTQHSIINNKSLFNKKYLSKNMTQDAQGHTADIDIKMGRPT